MAGKHSETQDERPKTGRKPAVLVLGPSRTAVSGVSTHLNVLLDSPLAARFRLIHFQVGSEGRTQGRVRRLARLSVGPFRLAWAVLRQRVALVHLNTSLNTAAFWRDWAHLLVAKLCGARVIYQVHGGALPHEFFRKSATLTWLLHRSLQLADAIVVLAQSELAAYVNFVPMRPVMAIPNAVDCARVAAPSPPWHGDRPIELLYLGRLAQRKGLPELLQGFATATARGVAARLTIAGSGPLEATLRRYASRLGVGDRIEFIGAVHGADKHAALRNADVFVLPSHAEGLPYALLEAMAAGVAVVTTRVGAIPDVVEEGVHGRFVPIGDAAAIASQIALLADDPGSLARMSIACRERIRSGYSTEQLTASFGAIYTALTSPDASSMSALPAALRSHS